MLFELLAFAWLTAADGACAKAPRVSLSMPAEALVGTAVPVTGSVQPVSGNRDCQIAGWQLSFGDGLSLTGNARTTISTTHVYDEPGSYTAELTAQSQSGPPATPARVRIVVSLPSPPPPPPTSARGPESTTTCPTGAVEITPDADINLIVEANAPGTTFCVRAGTHRPTRPIYLQTNDKLIGEFGSVIDGTNVTRTWDVGGISVISGWNCSPACPGVTVRNNTVRNSAQHSCIGVFGSNVNDPTTHPDNWVIDHNEVTDCHRGINLGNMSGVQVTNNVVRRISEGGLSSQNMWNALYDNNEVGWMGHESKLFRLKDSVVRRSWFHHGSNGLWFDGDNERVLVEDNVSEDMAGECYFYEISAFGTFRRNIARRCGVSGIFISNSRDTEVYENTFTDVWRGLNLFIDCSLYGNKGPLPANTLYPGQIEYDVRNNTMRDNTIVLSTRSGAHASVLTSGAGTCTSEFLAPYISNAKKNVWQGNDYDVPTPSGSTWFFWPMAFRTWAEWQALGQDTAGRVQ